MEYKYYKIGETFSFEGKTIRVEKDTNYSCSQCVFNGSTMCNKVICTAREDDTDVIFKDITGEKNDNIHLETLKNELESLKSQNSIAEKKNLIMKIMLLGSNYTVDHTKSLQEVVDESIKLLDSYIESLNK